MQVCVHGATDRGLVRPRNEDSFLVEPDALVFAVADGIGGMPGGDVASRTAIEALRSALHRDRAGALADLQSLVRQIHATVQQDGVRFGPEGIGTTLTLAHIEGARARLAHVGDSFALLVRAGRCRPITREHNVENEHRDRFKVAPRALAYRYALTRAVGQPEAIEADLFDEELRAGDRLILATDGLTDVVEDAEIVRLCREHAAPEALCDGLIRAALERGAPDNVTVVALCIAE